MHRNGEGLLSSSFNIISHTTSDLVPLVLSQLYIKRYSPQQTITLIRFIIINFLTTQFPPKNEYKMITK